MKGLNEIGNFFKSVQGIITCVIAVGAIVSSVLLRHDAKVRSKFVETHQSVNIIQVDSVVKNRIAPVIINQGNFDDRLNRDSISRVIFMNNYSRLLWDKFGSEWMKYMNGMQITVIQEPSLPTKSIEKQKPVYKIMMEKADTTKQKVKK